MKERTMRLFIGVIHQKDTNEDYADVAFIASTKEEADEKILSFKSFALKKLKLNTITENSSYIRYESSDGSRFFEAFYVERIIVLKGDNQ